MTIRNVFFNAEENRLRAGWRILAVYALTLLVFLPTQMYVRKLLPIAWAKDTQKDILLAFFAVISTVTIMLGRKFVDKKAISSLGVRFDKNSWVDYLFGFGVGFALVAIVVGLEVGFGWLKYSGEQAEWPVLLSRSIYLLFFSGLVVAWWENLFFVSFLYLNIKDGLNAKYSFIINLIIFGAVHMMNPNAGVMAFLGVALIHSYEIFGFIRTKTLWLILGIHSSWNFSQGFLGFPISGKTGGEVLKFTNSTPSWFGGNEFGPESGVVILATTIVAFALIEGYCRLRNQSYQSTEH